jgi:hypothetical protein
MSDVLERLQDAGRLLAYGLDGKRRTAHDPVYRELLRRFRAESDFRSVVEASARGLGLLVLGASDHGLVLGAEDDGVFAQRLADYRRQGLTVDERMAHGLLQLAIPAWCFPTAQLLEEADSVVSSRMSAGRLVRYVIDLCEELRRNADAEVADLAPELAPAWMAILARAETRTTRDGRRSPGTLAGMIAHALEHLADGGLLRRVNDDDGGTFQALGGYRRG